MIPSRRARLLRIAEQARAALARRAAQASAPSSAPPPPLGHYGEVPAAERRAPHPDATREEGTP
ncbi:hypothetical protein [Deinococcus soli (ex Cha et al. 2016)]|uniref:Uncharacterized protein n=2 Tax=Deinococcus soli (ex Cha et al. 2016) TaxID=1309411 RepID=A0AAE4BLZ6_9DEIO|nr:hypothetical protein [Deinococcus soli (ex Cha et al. 2016)]MDR6218540.1 hypothetical protein [Deinococcus soli (ex Cha et al. 2016)]MDR6329280.1 hypothetical protein [Deinococcus soli (ex Cha et al. 2016)]MDR6751553.1 hypothetical protein [Deinococcus soli (ex Cha et al. 2016)]